MSSETEIITHRQWENHAKRIEKKNIEKYGQSLTFLAFSRRALDHIIETDTETKLVKIGWREAMEAKEA